MSSNVCFLTLRIDSFRGFADPVEIDLNASAVILAGPNGTGKTSVFDAIQWLLLGRVKRLEDLRARRNVEHIVNQYRLPGRATVQAEIILNGTVVRLRRQGNQESSGLELESESGDTLYGDGAQAELERLLSPQPGISLASMLMTSGLLQQDVMRLVLEAKPSERYDHMRSLLGLGVLDDFETSVSDAAKQQREVATAMAAEVAKIQADLEVAKQRLEVLESRARSRPTVAKLEEAARSALATARSLVELSLPEAAPDWAGAAAEANRLATSLGDLAIRWEQLTKKRVDAPSYSAEEAETIRLALEEIERRRLTAAESARRKQRALDDAEARAQSLSNLASIAIPLLERLCPVCQQEINPEEVRRLLEQRTQEVSELVMFRETAAQSWRELQELDTERKRLETARQRLDELRAAQDRRLRELASLEHSLGREWSRLHHLRPVAQPRLEEVRESLGVWQTALSDVARAASAVASGASETSEVVASRAREAEVEALQEALKDYSARMSAAQARAALSKKLTAASVEASVLVTQERFDKIQPLVADIYGRLDPHPSFKTVEFQLSTYYRQGTSTPLVRDVLEDRAADPLVVFSTSQANIVALSYFLAMGFAASDRALPYVMLDDPLQSMDDVNVLAFADLCRYLRTRRQLIISTHERRFAHLLERKLAPRVEGQQTAAIEFAGWDRSGPFIERRDVPPQLMEADARFVVAG